MGKFDYNFSDDIEKQLNSLINVDEVAKKLLNEMQPVLKRAIVKETDKYHEWSKERNLVNSIESKKPKKGKHGWYATVVPTGTDEHGTRNMEKMAHLEYGYIDKSGEHVQPKPILTKAINESENQLEIIANKVMKEEVDKWT